MGGSRAPGCALSLTTREAAPGRTLCGRRSSERRVQLGDDWPPAQLALEVGVAWSPGGRVVVAICDAAPVAVREPGVVPVAAASVAVRVVLVARGRCRWWWTI
jgi:hypothetical protein